jgi:hypothetical protein
MLHEFGKRYFEKAPNALLAAIDERFQVPRTVKVYCCYIYIYIR